MTGIKQVVSLEQIVDILQKSLPRIRVEEKRNTKQKWGVEEPIPFDYGEIPEYINPADNMGWDFIVAPDSDPTNKNLRIAGIIKVKDNADNIPAPNGNKPGNHKLILGSEGRVSNDAMKIIKNWFKQTKVFDPPQFYNQNNQNPYTLKEKKKNNWEKATLAGYNLGHVNDGRWGGISVGPTAKKVFKVMKENNGNRLSQVFSTLLENETKYQIFQDLDGCLCDLESHFRNLSGENLGPKEYQEKYGKDAFWKKMESFGEEFWSEMPWMPDGKELWDYIKNQNPTILSAPSRDPKSVSGKMKWIEKNLPELANNRLQTKCKNGWDGVSKIILNPDKYRYVRGPNDILIDDTPEKINKWIQAGGTGILHTSAKHTIQMLKELGL
jgi:hypothetical protein